MPDEKLHARLPCRFDHRPAIGKRQRHRFLDQYVFARLGGYADVIDMGGVWTGYIDELDLAVGAQCLRGGVRDTAKLLGKPNAGLSSRVGPGYDNDTRIEDKRRLHQGEGASQSDYANADWTFHHRSITKVSDFARETQTMM
jgi:hypothetical protein